MYTYVKMQRKWEGAEREEIFDWNGNERNECVCVCVSYMSNHLMLARIICKESV